MSAKILTISREFGSGGRFIGEEIAKKLGMKYYDKGIIETLEKETGLDRDFIEKSGEYAPAKGIFAYSFLGRDGSGRSIQDIIYEEQRKIILELAEKESFVIIGRNADYILKDRDDVLNVFIHGDKPEKVKRICGLYDLTEREAEKRLVEIDKRRATHYHFYTDREWAKSQNYDLCLNSSVLGYEKCEEIIISCMK